MLYGDFFKVECECYKVKVWSFTLYKAGIFAYYGDQKVFFNLKSS